uniref:Reverse transcriptase domain-containing protein n=1 Tax=Strongyloides venezuelensis TaxID=75913 RepID=A0A0K0FSB0_STRVS
MITMESALALNINYQERLQSMLYDREKVVKTLNEIADQSPPVAHSLIENQSLWDESIPQPTERMKLPFIKVPKSSLAKPYDLKSTDKPKVAMEIARLLRLDQLLPIKLPIFSSPITSVISPNKTRICHDSRKLNHNMSNVDLQLPKLEEILGCISNQDDLVFVQLDLRDAFKLIGIADEHQQYSTISTVWGNFYSPLLQFGYRCAPGMFHNYFASLLNTQEFPDCIHYMDDIIFYGNISSLTDTLPKFFRKCSEKNFKLNLPKCKFFVNPITFLSFQLSNNGIQVPKEKIDSLLGESKPDSITGMRSVIGKINRISKFISNYGQIMSSLHPKSESKFVWSKRRTQDWNLLRDNITITLTLRFPKSFDTLIKIEFQPLPDALQSVITFEEEGEIKLLDVNSRKMSPTERNYAIIEKEMTIVGEHLKNGQKIICAYDCEFVTPFKATEHFIKFGLEYSSKNVSNVSARI